MGLVYSFEDVVVVVLSLLLLGLDRCRKMLQVPVDFTFDFLLVGGAIPALNLNSLLEC